MPMHICGGTYRSRNRRRTAPNGAEKLSYAEQKKRRIERKFGIAGEGKKISADVANISGKVKPRVAQSKRGRELRAAAALKRLEKKEEEESVKAEDDQTASESEDEKKAINVGGGKFMIAVSGEEDGKRESENLNRELMELLGGACGGTTKLALEGKSAPAKLAWSAAKSKLQLKEVATQPSDTNPDTDCVKMKRPLSPALHTSFTCTQPTAELDASQTNHSEPTTTSRTCPVCSFTNIPHAPTCTACMNVLTLATYAGSSWTCSNVSNCPREYRNSGDVAFCGICGSRRPPQSPSS